jgi:NAD(P)-dependent dehydrogenase (short-subunit alcohol dehydrogenase family)
MYFLGDLLMKFGELIKAGVPLGRIGRKSDIAGTCLFLASEAGSYVNGGMASFNWAKVATIVVDGGSVLNSDSKI